VLSTEELEKVKDLKNPDQADQLKERAAALEKKAGNTRKR
jgi:hypothetical protein